MKSVRKTRPFASIDLPSFSDLAFLLIIFFVLTTSFVTRIGTRTSIPSSTSDPKQQSQKDLPSISVSADGIYLSEEELTIEELRTKLVEMKLADKPEGERIIIVDSTPDVTFDRYFKIVTAISQAGGVLALVDKQEGATGQ